MSQPDNHPSPEVSSEENGETANHRTVATDSANRGGARLAIFLLLAIVAGVGAGFLTVRFASYFKYPPEVEPWLDSSGLSPEQTARMAELDRELRIKNTTLCAAISGALIAGLLGLAGAYGGGQVGKAILGLIVGVLLGAILGAAGGFAGTSLWGYLTDQDRDVTYLAVFANGVLWAMVGLAAGMSAGLAAGGLGKIAGGGVAGVAAGLLSAGLFLVVVSLLMPDVNTNTPIPGSDSPQLPGRDGVKLLWGLVSGAVIGLMVAVGTAPTPEKPKGA